MEECTKHGKGDDLEPADDFLMAERMNGTMNHIGIMAAGDGVSAGCDNELGSVGDIISSASPVPINILAMTVSALQKRVLTQTANEDGRGDLRDSPETEPEHNDEGLLSTIEDAGTRIQVAAEKSDVGSGTIPRDEEHVSLNNENLSTTTRNCPDEVLMPRYLANDTFSFLIFSNHCSMPSFLATMVYSLQLAIFALVCADVIDIENKGNPFNLPPNVESTVRIAEVLAISVAIITQDDVRKAVNLLRDGYDDDAFRDAFGCGVTRSKWMLSILLRGSEGLLGLFVTFLLIMQSDTVLDLLLNFSAMEFVSLIDDVVFALTTEGFFGLTMKREAKILSRTEYRVGHSSETMIPSLLTAGYFLMLFAAMLTGWGVIYSAQASGQYLCSNVFVQFDDDSMPSLGAYAGLYVLYSTFKVGDRVTYFSYANAMIGYCDPEKIWTLTLWRDGQEMDPCNDWIAASSESINFDVTETASSQWYARKKSGRVLPLDQYHIQCYDCKYKDDFCGEPSSHGTCIDNECICAEDRYGLRCEFEEPCSLLEVDPRSDGFVGNRIFASKYYRLDNADQYHRPIYTSSLQSMPGDNIDIIMFTGRRWVLTSSRSMADLTDIFLQEGINQTNIIRSYLGCIRYASDHLPWGCFIGIDSNYEVSFISEAVDIDSRTDVITSPLGLEWYHARARIGAGIQGPDLNRVVDANFICAECNDLTNPCFFGATCLDGTCEHDCPHGSTGTLCQIPPLANGRCDPYFNEMDFEYDGGDCCESSCLSTDEFTCGKDDTGYVDMGYFYCKEETDQWSAGVNPVYGVNSAARSGSSVALGGNSGSILAVGDPGANAVRLFDKDGSEWIQRGQILEGPLNSEFGLAISLSGESGKQKKNPFSPPLVTLAVGGPGAGMVRVYECFTNGCVQVGNDLTGDEDSRFGASVSISMDGTIVAVGGADSDCFACVSSFAEVYSRSSSASNDWGLHGNAITAPRLWRNLLIAQYQLHGYYVSLSGNGEGLAVGRIEGLVTPGPTYADANLITQVYKWNTTTEEWVWSPLGEEISKTHYLGDSARSLWPLRSLTLSDDGMILAIGSSRSVDVYSWNDTVSNWVQREVDLVVDPIGLVGWSVDLSGDGSVLAVGTSVESWEITDDSIRVHKWNGTHYSALFNGLPAGETSSVSLSRDGESLAVGLPFSGKKGGATRVYKFRPLSECGEKLQLLRLSFTTDGNPGETRWDLEVGSNEKIQSQSYHGRPFTTFVEEFCVPVGACVKFTVHDARANGMDPPGVYSLFLEGKEVARGGQFDYVDIKRIGDCDCPQGTSPFSIVARTNFYSPHWILSHQNRLKDSSLGGVVFTVDTGYDENSYSTALIEECIPDDCWSLSIFPVSLFFSDDCERAPGGQLVYNVTYNGDSVASSEHRGQTWQGFCLSNIDFGVCSSNQTIECDEGSMRVRIEITFNDQPWNTVWKLLDQDSDDAILHGDLSSNYIVRGATMYEEACKPVGACYYFIMEYATGISGFKVFLDDVEINTNSSTVPIGDSCQY